MILIGKAFRKKRDKVFIATKGGLLPFAATEALFILAHS